MITNIAFKAKSSYLNSRDRSDIENYLATTKARRAALDEVRRLTTPAVDKLINRMRAAYPQFTKFHNQAFEKGHRDMVLLTQMTANAMFLGEHDTLQDMFAEWYRTILKSVHMSPQFMNDTFTTWQEELQSTLSDESWSLMRPHVEYLSKYLTNVPVPARDETGERKPLPPLAPGAKTWKS
ncbi:allophycocyanin subunit alpha [soil metagenome]